MSINSILFKHTPIFYRAIGSGKRVILLHGFGEDGTIWQPQIDFLQTTFRVIVPDISGSGLSPFIQDGNIDSFADALKAVLDKEDELNPRQPSERYTLIGHSMGGYIALAFAQKFPQYLDRLGLFHSSAYADSEAKIAARLKSISFIESNGAQAFLKTSIPGLFTPSFAEKFPEKMEALIEKATAFSAEALVQYYQAMINRPDRTEVLRNFKGRILFVIGAHDMAVPMQYSLAQSPLPEQSQVTILQNSAHMGMWEETDKANAAMLHFCSDQYF